MNCVCELETKYNFILPYYIICFNNDVKRKRKKLLTQNQPRNFKNSVQGPEQVELSKIKFTKTNLFQLMTIQKLFMNLLIEFKNITT